MNSKNKTIATMITAILMISMMATLIPAETNAYNIMSFPTFLFCSAAPDPVGVGQPITIVAWTSETVMPSDEDASLGAANGREGWVGITVTLTKPDGTSQVINMGLTDPVGSCWYTFTPDQVGTYSIQANFPGNWKNRTAAITNRGTNRNYVFGAGSYYFEPSTSTVETFTVQEEQLTWIPGVPLPSEFWSRPVDSRNREWAPIVGNWLNDGQDNPYTQGPESAHVLWTKPLFIGGLIGEPRGASNYYDGTSYEQKWSTQIILDGRLYYNQPISDESSQTAYQIATCVDLRTGQTIWSRNGTTVSRGEIYQYDSINQHGAVPVIWRDGNVIIDPLTGYDIYRFTSVPSGSRTVGETGETLIYQMDAKNGWLALWNSTASESMRSMPLAVDERNFEMWRPVGKVVDGKTAYSWNVTIPKGLTGSISQVLDDRIVGSAKQDYAYLAEFNNVTQFSMWCISTAKTTRGQLLWNVTPSHPTPNDVLGISSSSLEDKVLVVFAKEDRKYIGYDLDTGAQKWITSTPEDPWLMYSGGSYVYEHKFYAAGYGGTVYCYDITNGNLLWNATANPEGLESAYKYEAMQGGPTVLDGKVYVYGDEHSHSDPLYRSWRLYCFNATTGERIFDFTGYWLGFAFADGVMASLNCMDGQVYAIGKGPSATSVSVQNDVITEGNSVLLTGKLTDISAGTKQTAITARFPNGVPVVSDDGMSAWMDYVYKQYPKPTNTTGVTVSLDVVDANGNFRNIGTTTTDANGFYSYKYTPDITGKYTVYASFAGSKSFYGSQGITAFAVDAAPQGTPAPTPAAASIADTYFVPAIAGIIVAIIVVGLLLAVLLLRKRP